MKAKARHCGRGKRWAAGAGLAFAGLVAGVGAQAQPAEAPVSHSHPQCPIQPSYPLPAGEDALQQLLARIDFAAPRCLLDPAFHAWRGAVLLSLRKPAAAIESLERALLIEPDLPGAQLDYAQALLAVGDRLAARDLLQQLSRRTDMPTSLRGLLQEELAATDPNVWRNRWVVTSALGKDSNLNNAPAASELTLTFPQGPVTLPLLDSFKPQRGTAWLNAVQWQGLKPQGTQLWVVQAELRARHTEQASARYQQADLSASWLQSPEAPRQWVARLGATRIDFGGQHLLQSVRGSALHQWQGRWPLEAVGVSHCRPGLGAELERRRYPVTPELDGRYAGVVASASCQSLEPSTAGSAFLATQALNFQLRLGRERPESGNRPGGTYDKAEARVTWEGRSGAYRLVSDYAYTRQKDSSGYSPLLSDNLARTLGRHSVRLEVTRSLPASLLGGADWFVSAEATRQASNLAAFSSRQTAFYSGLRWSL